jgi:NAD(P)H-nitrite reductase large subunit
MNDNSQNSKNDIICGCSGTTSAQIQVLLNQGVLDLDRISRITGALSGCGGCEFDLQVLLRDHQNKINLED